MTAGAFGRLLLIGAGGLSRETAQAVSAEGVATVVGILDDDVAKTGTEVAGMPVLGTTADLPGIAGEVGVIATVASSADPERRLRLVARLGLAPERWGAVVHPAASLATSTLLGRGSVVLAGTVATADVTIGDHVVIMPGCVLTHDVRLADGVTLAAGVLLAGGVEVGRGAYLGSGAKVREGVRIGAGAVVGMGSVVLRDVPAGETWLGVPARPVRRR